MLYSPQICTVTQAMPHSNAHKHKLTHSLHSLHPCLTCLCHCRSNHCALSTITTAQCHTLTISVCLGIIAYYPRIYYYGFWEKYCMNTEWSNTPSTQTAATNGICIWYILLSSPQPHSNGCKEANLRRKKWFWSVQIFLSFVVLPLVFVFFWLDFFVFIFRKLIFMFRSRFILVYLKAISSNNPGVNFLINFVRWDIVFTSVVFSQKL